jgi:hypothetical protein
MAIYSGHGIFTERGHGIFSRENAVENSRFLAKSKISMGTAIYSRQNAVTLTAILPGPRVNAATEFEKNG